MVAWTTQHPRHHQWQRVYPALMPMGVRAVCALVLVLPLVLPLVVLVCLHLRSRSSRLCPRWSSQMTTVATPLVVVPRAVVMRRVPPRVGTEQQQQHRQQQQQQQQGQPGVMVPAGTTAPRPRRKPF